MRFLYILLLTALPLTFAKGQTLLINEFRQGNVDCVIADDNDIPNSWVELYNTSSAAINLKDYRIGVEKDFNEAYPLPDKQIQGNGYALIYCDKNKTGMHTHFKLDSGKGGSIYLYNNKGEVIDKIEDIKKQPAPNIAYGRESDGQGKMGYMLIPTPGKANNGGIVDNKKILPEPIFSHTGKVYEKSTRVSVQISLPEDAPQETVIRYTTDGSEPTENSPQVSGAIVVNNATVLRAKLFCQGYLSPLSTTHSYIFHGREQTIPIISLVTDSKFFYDDKLGIYVDGTYSKSQKNYEYDWKRPVNFEYFPTGSEEAALNQLCETRVGGAASRDWVIKSLMLYADKRLGVKRLTYEFFPTERPGITDFKSVMLRNSGNDRDYMYFRDAAIQHNMAMNTDLDWQAWQPTAMYLNGKYIGMINIRERSNEDNIYSNYDGLEDIDMIENWSELKEGTIDDFNTFKAFYTASENEENTNMDRYAEMMDIDEYLNVMILNIFHNNLDFPGNNIVQWKPRTPEGKWRWIVKDTDFGLGLYNRPYEYKYIHWLYDNNYDSGNNWANKSEHTRLFRRLMADYRFRDRFIDRMAVYMGEFLNGNGLATVIDSMYNVIKTEYPYHRKPINQWWPNHTEEINNAKKWAANRTTFMWKYLKDYFKLPGDPKTLIINAALGEKAKNYDFTLNDTPLKNGKYSGSFYSGREVRLESKWKDGVDEIAEWTITTNIQGKTTTQTIKGKDATFTIPTNAAVVTAEAKTEASGIHEINAADAGNNSMPSAIYSIDGKKINMPNKPGIYITSKWSKIFYHD